MNDPATLIAQNVAQIHERIAAAAHRAKRSPSEITLLAVTKYVDVDLVRLVVAAGCHDLGESRPQELQRKASKFGNEPIRWHLIGHLQRNKIGRTLPHVALVHSADSERLLAAIHAESEKQKRCTPLLLEVNISGNEAKHGFTPDQVAAFLPKLNDLPHIEIRGLMTMAGWAGDPEAARNDFRNLRKLRDRLAADCPPNVALEELSMGMSGDFEIAIEEGATLVRVGSALFEGIPR